MTMMVMNQHDVDQDDVDYLIGMIEKPIMKMRV